jgi:hypothetical protein
MASIYAVTGRPTDYIFWCVEDAIDKFGTEIIFEPVPMTYYRSTSSYPTNSHLLRSMATYKLKKFVNSQGLPFWQYVKLLD